MLGCGTAGPQERVGTGCGHGGRAPKQNKATAGDETLKTVVGDGWHGRSSACFFRALRQVSRT
eukprot:2740518-Lingulodinium_polyedra.AAC.1